MRKILLIFALLIASCNEKEQCPTFPVTISDALPIQFWLSDCETYNEKEVCGVHHKCWCHPWQCDDEITIQFTDDTNDDYTLSILDENGDEIQSYEFLKQVVITSPYMDELSTGTNHGSGLTWTTGSNPTVTGLTTGLITKRFRVPIINALANEVINFTVNLDFNNLGGSGGTFNTTPIFYIFDSAMEHSVQVGGGDLGGVYISAGNKIETHSLTPDFAPAYLVVTFEYTGSGGFTMGVDINSMTIDNEETYRSVYSLGITPSVSPDLCNQRIRFEIINTTSSPDQTVAKSDCIDIRDSHDCTTLVSYSNNRNFAGLIYEDVSPETTFQIRVPAIFFHERFPEEDNAIELTSGIIKTSGVVKAQTLFETDYMPYYMHKKLKLIFKHQTININDQNWIKEEAYEISEGDRRWPVKKAKCFLTESNFVQRAVL